MRILITAAALVRLLVFCDALAAPRDLRIANGTIRFRLAQRRIPRGSLEQKAVLPNLPHLSRPGELRRRNGMKYHPAVSNATTVHSKRAPDTKVKLVLGKAPTTNGMPSWYIDASLGGKKVSLVPDTGVNKLWILDQGFDLFDYVLGQPLKTFTDMVSISDQRFDSRGRQLATIGPSLSNTIHTPIAYVSGNWYEEKVCINHLCVDDQVFMSVDNVSPQSYSFAPMTGTLGLGPRRHDWRGGHWLDHEIPFFVRLMMEGKLAAPEFSVCSTSRQHGHIILGGRASNAFTGDARRIEADPEAEQWKIMVDELKVQGGRAITNYEGKGKQAVFHGALDADGTTGKGPLTARFPYPRTFAIVDTAYDDIFLPTKMFARLANVFEPSDIHPRRYIEEVLAVHCSIKYVVKIVIGGHEYPLGPADYFDSTSEPYASNGIRMCVTVFARMAEGVEKTPDSSDEEGSEGDAVGNYILGTPFLSTVYTTFAFENRNGRGPYIEFAKPVKYCGELPPPLPRRPVGRTDQRVRVPSISWAPGLVEPKAESIYTDKHAYKEKMAKKRPKEDFDMFLDPYEWRFRHKNELLAKGPRPPKPPKPVKESLRVGDEKRISWLRRPYKLPWNDKATYFPWQRKGGPPAPITDPLGGAIPGPDPIQQLPPGKFSRRAKKYRDLRAKAAKQRAAVPYISPEPPAWASYLYDPGSVVGDESPNEYSALSPQRLQDSHDAPAPTGLGINVGGVPYPEADSNDRVTPWSSVSSVQPAATPQATTNSELRGGSPPPIPDRALKPNFKTGQNVGLAGSYIPTGNSRGDTQSDENDPENPFADPVDQSHDDSSDDGYDSDNSLVDDAKDRFPDIDADGHDGDSSAVRDAQRISPNAPASGSGDDDEVKDAESRYPDISVDGIGKNPTVKDAKRGYPNLSANGSGDDGEPKSSRPRSDRSEGPIASPKGAGAGDPFADSQNDDKENPFGDPEEKGGGGDSQLSPNGHDGKHLTADASSESDDDDRSISSSSTGSDSSERTLPSRQSGDGGSSKPWWWGSSSSSSNDGRSVSPASSRQSSSNLNSDRSDDNNTWQTNTSEDSDASPEPDPSWDRQRTGQVQAGSKRGREDDGQSELRSALKPEGAPATERKKVRFMGLGDHEGYD